jgi:hypothetical protein
MARSRKPQPSVTTSTRSSRSPSATSRSGQSSPDRPEGPLSFLTKPEDREEVKVNNANLTELKHACDDAVRRVGYMSFLEDVIFLLTIFLHGSPYLGLTSSNK